jgi:nitrogen fixation protein FixH
MRQARPRSWWIPWLFVLFLAVILAANGTLIWIALRSWTGLATEHAYDKGLQYNRNLEAARRQAGLGWQPRLEVRMVEGFTAEAALHLADAAGAPLDGAAVTAGFARPTHGGSDFSVPLAPDGPGRYRASFTLPFVGLWDVHLTIRRGDDLFVRDQRVMLQ